MIATAGAASRERGLAPAPRASAGGAPPRPHVRRKNPRQQCAPRALTVRGQRRSVPRRARGVAASRNFGSLRPGQLLRSGLRWACRASLAVQRALQPTFSRRNVCSSIDTHPRTTHVPANSPEAQTSEAAAPGRGSAVLTQVVQRS